MKETRFVNISDIQNCVLIKLKAISKDDFSQSFHKLYECQSILSLGEIMYFEGQIKVICILNSIYFLNNIHRIIIILLDLLFYNQFCWKYQMILPSYLYLYSLRKCKIIYCGCLTGKHTRHPNSYQIPSELFADTGRASHASRRCSFTRNEELSNT